MHIVKQKIGVIIMSKEKIIVLKEILLCFAAFSTILKNLTNLILLLINS